MKKYSDSRTCGRDKIANKLRQLPVMQSALESLDNQIRCVCLDLEYVRREPHEDEETKQNEIIRREFLVYEQLVIQRNAILRRVQDLERALARLDDEERELLSAFFSPTYTRDTPFDLMERHGYEKSQLYLRRARALDHLAEYLAIQSTGS